MVTEDLHLPNLSSNIPQMPSLSRYVPADETFRPVVPEPKSKRSGYDQFISFEPLQAPVITPEMISSAPMPSPGVFIPVSLPFVPAKSSSRKTRKTKKTKKTRRPPPPSSPPSAPPSTNPCSSKDNSAREAQPPSPHLVSVELPEGSGGLSPCSSLGETTDAALRAAPLPPPYPGKNPIPEALRQSDLIKFELRVFTSETKAPDCPYRIPLETDDLAPREPGRAPNGRTPRRRPVAVQYQYHCVVAWGPSEPVPEYAEPGDIWINTGEQKAVWIVNKDGKHVRWPGNLPSDQLPSDGLAHPWATDLYLSYGGRNGWNWWSQKAISKAVPRLAKGYSKFGSWLVTKYDGREEQRPSLGTDVDAVEHWAEKKGGVALVRENGETDDDDRPTKRSRVDPEDMHIVVSNHTLIPPEGDDQAAVSSQHADGPMRLEGSSFPLPDGQPPTSPSTHVRAEALEQVTPAALDDESMDHPSLPDCPIIRSQSPQTVTSTHIMTPSPETPTLSAVSPTPARAKLFTIQHKTRTVLARRPKTYQAALELAQKHFPSLADKDVYFQSTEIDFAAGKAVELPDDIWEDVVDSLTAVEVFERTDVTGGASDLTLAAEFATGRTKSRSPPPGASLR